MLRYLVIDGTIIKIIIDGEEAEAGGETSAPGDGLSKDGDTLNVDTPTRGIYTHAEFDALPEEKRNKGLYVISRFEKSWWSPGMTSDTTPSPYSCSASSDMPGYGSSGIFAAFDGIGSTFWANNNADTNAFISFDFGKIVSVDGLRMTPRVGYPSQLPVTFSVKVSTDNATWTTIYTVTGLPQVVEGEKRLVKFPNTVNCRYIKIDGMRSTFNGGPYIGIADIEFHTDSFMLLDKLVIDGDTVEVDSDSDGGSSEEVYSTEETRIGTWVDGRPLYRRVFTFDSSATQTAITSCAGLHIVRATGGIYSGNGYWFAVPDFTVVNSTTIYFSCFKMFPDNVLYYTTNNTTGGTDSITCILEYTKSTDPATAALTADQTFDEEV